MIVMLTTPGSTLPPFKALLRNVASASAPVNPAGLNRSAEPNPRQRCVDRVLVEGGRIVRAPQPLHSLGVVWMAGVGEDAAQLAVAPYATTVLGWAGTPAGEADGVLDAVGRMLSTSRSCSQESPKS